MCLDASRPVYTALRQVYTASRPVSVITYDLVSNKYRTQVRVTFIFLGKTSYEAVTGQSGSTARTIISQDSECNKTHHGHQQNRHQCQSNTNPVRL